MCESLAAQLVADANSVQKEINVPIVADDGRNKNSQIGIGQIKAAISDGVKNAQDGIVKSEASLGCPTDLG